jgi:hypothetical protein
MVDDDAHQTQIQHASVKESSRHVPTSLVCEERKKRRKERKKERKGDKEAIKCSGRVGSQVEGGAANQEEPGAITRPSFSATRGARSWARERGRVDGNEIRESERRREVRVDGGYNGIYEIEIDIIIQYMGTSTSTSPRRIPPRDSALHSTFCKPPKVDIWVLAGGFHAHRPPTTAPTPSPSSIPSSFHHQHHRPSPSSPSAITTTISIVHHPQPHPPPSSHQHHHLPSSPPLSLSPALCSRSLATTTSSRSLSSAPWHRPTLPPHAHDPNLPPRMEP